MVAVSVASVAHCHVKQVTCFMYGTTPVQHHSCTGARELRALPTLYNIARRSVGTLLHPVAPQMTASLAFHFSPSPAARWCVSVPCDG